MKYEPGYDHLFPYGERGELLIGDLLLLPLGEVHVEDKRKQRVDGKFYVELEQDPGRTGNYKPSGLSVTKAKVWAFLIADTGVVVFIMADRLRAAIAAGLGCHAEEKDGINPTRGRLLSFSEFLATSLPDARIISDEADPYGLGPFAECSRCGRRYRPVHQREKCYDCMRRPS